MRATISRKTIRGDGQATADGDDQRAHGGEVITEVVSITWTVRPSRPRSVSLTLESRATAVPPVSPGGGRRPEPLPLNLSVIRTPAEPVRIRVGTTVPGSRERRPTRRLHATAPWRYAWAAGGRRLDRRESNPIVRPDPPRSPRHRDEHMGPAPWRLRMVDWRFAGPRAAARPCPELRRHDCKRAGLLTRLRSRRSCSSVGEGLDAHGNWSRHRSECAGHRAAIVVSRTERRRWRSSQQMRPTVRVPHHVRSSCRRRVVQLSIFDPGRRSASATHVSPSAWIGWEAATTPAGACGRRYCTGWSRLRDSRRRLGGRLIKRRSLHSAPTLDHAMPDRCGVGPRR